MDDTTTPIPDNAKPVEHDSDDRREEVAEIASHVYEVREGKDGTPQEDWLKAEAILARKEREAATEQPLVTHTEVLPKSEG